MRTENDEREVLLDGGGTISETTAAAYEAASEHDEEFHGDIAPEEAGDATVDINELDAQVEALEDVDPAKMEERLEYAPAMKPGTYHNFIFKLREDKPVQPVVMKGKTHALFNYEAQEVRDDGSLGKLVKFQNVNTFRAGKMEASRADELLFALGKTAAFKQTGRKPTDILNLLREATGQSIVFRGMVHWRHYDSTTGVTTHTAPAKPYKKKDKATGQQVTVVEQPWPREKDGTFSRHPGNEVITRVAPTPETLAEMKAAGNGATESVTTAA